MLLTKIYQMNDDVESAICHFYDTSFKIFSFVINMAIMFSSKLNFVFRNLFTDKKYDLHISNWSYHGESLFTRA